MTQPIDKVEWVDLDALKANDYNPNKVAPPELKLLKLSILEDGWTQPIVARPDGTIIDGFHRWTVAKDPAISKLTDGKVPVVRLDVPIEQQMLSTIRHNRARGTHGILKMGDIVLKLKAKGLNDKQIQERLGMDSEEVRRLLDETRMVDNVSDDFSEGWVPKKRP